MKGITNAQNANNGGITEDQIIIKSSSIPTASAENLDKIYIYDGEDDGEFVHGYIYQCKEVSSESGESSEDYEWQRIDVQPTPSIYDSTITINQGGQLKGSFTLNQNNNTVINLDAGGGGGSSATINFYDINNWTLDQETKTHLTVTETLGNSVFVFKNGVLLQGESNNNDYTISGNIITFVVALRNDDKIAIINGDISGIDLTAYSLKPIVVTDADNTGLVVKANTIYKFDYATPLTTLTITSAEVSDYESVIHFATGTGTIQFTTPNTLKWGGGNQQPELEPNTVYCIAICNGLAEIDNFGTTGA